MTKASGELITFRAANGEDVEGWYCTPDGGGGGLPGLVVIQEWWGLNEQIKKTGERFAAEGFRVIVPDLYRGKLTTDADEANHLMGSLDWGQAVQDVAGAQAWLKASGSAKTGVTGFCMGGAITILAAVHVDATDAGACFYGIPPAEAADPSTIGVPFIAHFASEDDWCTPAAVDELEAKLQAGGVDATIYRYEGRQHAFFNEARPEVHDAQAAALSFERTIAFFKAQLAA